MDIACPLVCRLERGLPSQGIISVNSTNHTRDLTLMYLSSIPHTMPNSAAKLAPCPRRRTRMCRRRARGRRDRPAHRGRARWVSDSHGTLGAVRHPPRGQRARRRPGNISHRSPVVRSVPEAQLPAATTAAAGIVHHETSTETSESAGAQRGEIRRNRTIHVFRSLVNHLRIFISCKCLRPEGGSGCIAHGFKIVLWTCLLEHL